MLRFEPALLKESPKSAFALERAVRLQDVDAAGTVFFVRVLEYASDAFVEFCDACGIDLGHVLSTGAWGAPLRHAEADYYRPLFFGDRIRVELVQVHLEPTEVALGYRVVRPRDGAVAAVVQANHVFVQARSFERRPVPGELFAALEAARQAVVG